MGTSLHRYDCFFNDPATTEIYPLSLHDALPICCCSHPAPPRSRSCRRSPAPLGTAPRLSSADPCSGATGVSATSCDDRDTSQSTEIDDAWTRAPERDPKTAENPLSGGQKGSLTRHQGFK